MKLLETSKDGGAESTVWAHWLFEIKSLASAVLLRFENGTRDAFHNHAFNCISWVLSGKLEERHLDGRVQYHYPSWKPVITRRETFHQVCSFGRTWVLSFRGPWAKTWEEIENGEEKTLTNGRRVVSY
jgi:hypothetical protein